MNTESTAKSKRDIFELAFAAGGQWFNSFELRSVRRIMAIWFGLFFVGCVTQHNRSHNFTMETFQIAVCAVGLVMAAAWTVFYGELVWQRVFKFVSLVVATTTIGVLLSGYASELDEMVLATALASAVGLVPFYCAKKFLGWRIIHLESDPVESDAGSQFSIAQIMSWTTFFAVLIVIANLVSKKLFRSDYPEFLFFLFLAMIVPAAISLIFFGLVGRLSTPALVVVSPLFALGFAITMCIFLSFFGGPSGDLWRYVFWPNLVWFSFAGWTVTGAIWILRSRGFVFAFGSIAQSISTESLHEYKVRSLEHRIASTNSWRRRLAGAYAWIERQLTARNESLNLELSLLDDASTSKANTDRSVPDS